MYILNNIIFLICIDVYHLNYISRLKNTETQVNILLKKYLNMIYLTCAINCFGIRSGWKHSSLNKFNLCALFLRVIILNYKFVEKVIAESKTAFKNGEVPVGAIIVKDNKIIAKAHNMKEKKKCALMHAELIAIKRACKKLNNWRLNDCEMYVTLEPCPMCASAIKQSRISKVFYLFSNKNKEISRLVENIFSVIDANKKVELIKLDFSLNDNIVSDFFKNKN